jgi:alpha-beta hydrolase superfamily lysophospholipase
MTDDRTGTLEAAGGMRLFYTSRVREGSRGRLLAVHGLGDHSGRFAEVARRVVAAGYDFYGLDLRGHGRSQGRRGHTRSFDLLLSDLDLFRRSTGDRESDRPTVLLGHSLGGLIVGRYVQEYGFPGLAGAVLVAPFVDSAMSLPTWKLGLGDLADRLIPPLTMDNGIDAGMLFRTAEERAAHESDPLVHHRISARLWGEMRRQARVLVVRADQSRTPFLIQLAGDDLVVSTLAGRDLAARLAGNTRVIVYEDAYHDLYRDPVAERATADLVKWLGERLGDAGSAAGDVAV